MKKNELLLLVLLAVLISLASFILSLLSFPNNTIQGGATSETVSLSITLEENEYEVEVNENGECYFTDDEVNDVIARITNLTAGQRVNASLLGAGFPSSWTERKPNSSEVGNKKIEFFEIKINASTAGGSYRLYFNVTSANLGTLPINNVSLFIFNDTSQAWQNLSTVVVNGSNDPRQFYGITPHFSKFLIGERPAGSSEGGESGSGSGSSGSGGSGGGGGGGSVTKKKPVEEAPEEVLKEVGEIPLKPIHKPGILFDVSVNIPERYRKMLPGETLIGEISLINIKKIGLVAVQINYQLQDAKGNSILQIYETKTVENEFTYLKELELPDDLKPGYYMFFIQVTYGEDIALAGYPFQVVEEPAPSALVGLAAFLINAKTLSIAVPIMLGLIVVIILILYFIHRRNTGSKSRDKSGSKPFQRLKSLYRKK